jgi:FkbM family methyltransferase
MSLLRYGWSLRRLLYGSEVVVTSEQVAALAKSRALDTRGRLRMRMLYLRELALGPPRNLSVVVGSAQLELGGDGDDFGIDWKTFAAIFGDEEYAAAYEDARVLDVGAHKGYFGAYALARGAAAVLSYEPARANHAVLERAARPFGARWVTRNAALGEEGGTGTLLLDRTSWAHSLRQVDRPAGEQPVAIVTLEHALAELPAAGSRTIVKIDAEGSECEILARSEALEPVDVLFVEWHPKSATCTAEQLSVVARSAGLTSAAARSGLLSFERAASDRHQPVRSTS